MKWNEYCIKGIESELAYLLETYDADIHPVRNNPNTPADIHIYYKNVFVWLQKAYNNKYYLDIWENHKPVYKKDTWLETTPWDVVLSQLDKWIPIKKEVSLF